MAKQNFLAGGYYGKLGETVGQRWKNIRTIRAYVVPRNPRTEKQQGNRGKFGDCVFYAQIANQMNYKATCFDSPRMSPWNVRMSIARDLQNLGLSEMDRIPLYPVDFSLPFKITAANIVRISSPTDIVVQINGNIPTAERVFVMLLKLDGAGDWKDRLVLCVGNSSDAKPNEISFRIPEGVALTSNLQCRIVTIDDKDSSTDLCASQTIPLEDAAVDEHTFDTTVSAPQVSANTFSCTFGENFFSGVTTVETVSLRAVVAGEWEEITLTNPTLINIGGKFGLSATLPTASDAKIPALPSGSVLKIGKIAAESTSIIADAIDVSENLSNTDLTRNYDNTISSVSRSGNDFTFNFNSALPAFDSQNGTVSVRSVQNGAFVTNSVVYSIDGNSLKYSESPSANENLSAFPSGASITVNLTFTSNGVTYSPKVATAQNVQNTDLSRTIETWTAEVDDGGLEPWITHQFGASGGTTNSATIAGTLLHNRSINFEEVARTAQFYINGDTLHIANFCPYEEMLFLDGAGFTVTGNSAAVVNGVTYTPIKTQIDIDSSDMYGGKTDVSPSWLNSEFVTFDLAQENFKSIAFTDSQDVRINGSQNALETVGGTRTTLTRVLLEEYLNEGEDGLHIQIVIEPSVALSYSDSPVTWLGDGIFLSFTRNGKSYELEILMDETEYPIENLE